MATVQASDVLPVRSRVAWGAIFAGSFIAIAMIVLLGHLGVALGLSVADRADGESMGIAAGIWTAVTLLLSLFMGGFVASRCTVGENKTEAVFYGALVWGGVLTFSALLGLGALAAGAAGASGINQATAAATRMNIDVSVPGAGQRWTEQDLQKAGVTLTPEQRQKLATDPAGTIRQAANNPEVRRAATEAAWWTFAGLALSIGAAVAGAVVGAGPNLILASFRVRGVTAVETPGGRELVNR